MGQHATRRDGHAAQKLVQLVVVLDGQLQESRRHALLLVVAGGVASQLEELSRQVLQDCREVNRGRCANPAGVPLLADHASDAANREGQACLLGLASAGCGLAALLSYLLGLWGANPMYSALIPEYMGLAPQSPRR
eukprot:NODE_2020_length_522_cov_702.651629_g2005_i0.p1 GENE.NODE_2020_length_522_cov_702.651629_g2005_i0~~NODE_2020_length_522_cov_702.651629_g2005_i0.p1  ORF type:complete len:136 (+),score=11.97 NODE_2020_length_522_cov_702.651629_g2005_i0:107-514(+)